MSNNYPKYAKYEQYQKGKKLSLWERFGVFFRNARRIMKIANKPGRKDYFLVFKICAILVFKICAIGILVLGVLSYVIQLIWTLINAVLGIR
ncbi:MAG: SecE/sec61-gamma family protein translocase subunit [Candidatus Heimdallarchaeaceae archaeon]